MTPIEYYQEQIQNGFITVDPLQQIALQSLQRLYHDLVQESERRQGFLSLFHKSKSCRGVYLWGSVGIGKTFLMDCFYQTLPFPQKMRMHFHAFMQMVHNQLQKHQGEADPLQAIAKELASKTLVLCFDELFVSDITDAMILGRLFRALFSYGLTLVATTNVAPDDLYKNGLQRLNFLPVIAMLKQETEVVQIPSLIDYRLRHLQEAGVFYTPLDEKAAANMEKSFQAITQGQTIETGAIEVCNRSIKIIKRSDSVVWFDFADICYVPRSQADYLEIASRFKTVFVSQIPIIDASEKDTICLFIGLIDVLYDARVRLVFSAQESVELIYNRGFMIAEFTRTHSRLLEMQSRDYFTNNE